MTGNEKKSPSLAWRVLRGSAVALGIFVLGVGIAAVIAHEPRPDAEPSAEADALARRMMTAVRAERWEETRAVRFRFFDNHHLWDRERGFSEIRWGDTRVLLRVEDQTGFAFEGGRRLEGDAARAALENAWARFCNDTFWLNPVVKAFDEGTTRALVPVEGHAGLLVEYGSGGVTPGDAYLWILEEDGTPVAWKMWVGILPIGGVRTSWEGWLELSTGARVATRHEGALLAFSLEDVEGARSLAELTGGEDPFAALVR